MKKDIRVGDVVVFNSKRLPEYYGMLGLVTWISKWNIGVRETDYAVWSCERRDVEVIDHDPALLKGPSKEENFDKIFSPSKTKGEIMEEWAKEKGLPITNISLSDRPNELEDFLGTPTRVAVCTIHETDYKIRELSDNEVEVTKVCKCCKQTVGFPRKLSSYPSQEV